MEQDAAHDLVEFENDLKEEGSVMLDNHTPPETSFGFYSLPESLRRIMADYISNDKKDPTKLTLLGKPHVTLCLSQNADLELGSFWHFGCLSPEDQWKTSMAIKVDMKCLIKDYQSCHDFIGCRNSPMCPFDIEVLVFQFDVASKDFPSTLNDFQDALVHLGDHLKRVQHVVFAIDKNAFCYFSFKNAIGDATRRHQAVDRLIALKQITDDLRTCCESQRKLGIMMLLDYYILQDDKPKSDLYFSKFVISLKHHHNRDLFDAIDPTLKPSKLKWLYCLETVDEVKNFDQGIARRCHAFHLDTSKIDGWNYSVDPLPPANCFEDNPFIERIIISSSDHGRLIQLPQPSKPLTKNTPRSALIEFMLTDGRDTLHLEQLNNGYFTHLAHLTIIGGEITGRLYSQNVPSLKTLRIELLPKYFRSVSDLSLLEPWRTQPLIDTGRPWQLIATQELGGWSLASCDEPTANPQDEVKDEAVHSRPFIKELMLVMEFHQHASEFQSRLNGHPSPEAAADDRNEGLLEWAPERVEKITAVCALGEKAQLHFNEKIPGKTRILTSLVCYDVEVELHGVALPLLQSLKLNGGKVKLWGSFPQLQKLSFKKTRLQLPWQVDAPLLESLDCNKVCFGHLLSLRPQLLPHLSYLWINLWEDIPANCPTILVDEGGPGLSHVKHVVFGREMTMAPGFDQWQVHMVSNLELAVSAWKLPVWWDDTEWLCETLTINVFAHFPERLRETGITVIKMPQLMSRVKKMTVTSPEFPALLDSEMPNLTDCAVESPSMLGANFRCPALKCICFTDEVLECDREICLNPTTYEAIGAQPKWVYFKNSGEVHRMSWDVAPSGTGVSTFAGPLEDGGNSCVLHE